MLAETEVEGFSANIDDSLGFDAHVLVVGSHFFIFIRNFVWWSSSVPDTQLTVFV